jgi:CBS domain containing-hemolysin-like protein
MLSPFVTLLIRFTNGIISLFGGPRSDKTHEMPTEKEIKFLINYIDEYGLMESEKTSMLQSIFELGTTPVKDIMAPAPSIIRIEAKKTVADAYDMFIEHQFTRLPVYKGNQENIVGMLHLKDIIAYVKEHDDHPISTHIRPILFIPESMKINQLLKEFRSQGMHIAIVINEHGSITGLATLEDVLEKIVGDIKDEYESTTKEIISLDDNSWLVDARIELDEVEKLLETSIECESGITLGGFLIEQFQHLPKKGERLSYKTFTFQVQQATKKQILQVLIFTNTEDSIEKKKGS